MKNTFSFHNENVLPLNEIVKQLNKSNTMKNTLFMLVCPYNLVLAF